MVLKEPSPQLTVICQGLSSPGSPKEPSWKLCVEPSLLDWSAGAVTLGATLATLTTCTDSESVLEAPSESVTLILTSVWAGPAGKKQSKLPPLALVESEPATYWPPVPQSG